MVSYEPTVAGNIRKHERDIRKLGTAPLGPVSLGPGDHIRPEGSAAFRFDQSGAYSSHRGVLWNLSDLTDDFATSIEEQAATIASNTSNILGIYNSVTGHSARIAAAEGRLSGHDSTLSSHDTRISKAQSDVVGVHASVGALNTRMGAAEGSLDSHDARISKAQSDVVGVYNTVVEHDGRITTARSAAATAQSRADAAYSLANGRATKAEVAAAEDKAENARLQALSVQNALVSWINAARNEIPGLPPPPGF